MDVLRESCVFLSVTAVAWILYRKCTMGCLSCYLPKYIEISLIFPLFVWLVLGASMHNDDGKCQFYHELYITEQWMRTRSIHYSGSKSLKELHVNHFTFFFLFFSFYSLFASSQVMEINGNDEMFPHRVRTMQS